MVWDPATADWSTCPETGERVLQDERTREFLWPMRRLAPLAMYTGSRTDCMLSATWSLHRDRPWVDLESSIFFRSGGDEVVTNKRRPPVRLTPKVVALARVWRDEDVARGIDLVIHDGKGRPLGTLYWQRVAMLIDAAGLPPETTMQTLRLSCAVWLREGGRSPTETAAFLGNTEAVGLPPLRFLRPLVLSRRCRRPRLEGVLMVENLWHRIFIAKSSTAKLAPLRLFNVLNGLRPIRKEAARADEINKIVASKKSDEHRPMAHRSRKTRVGQWVISRIHFDKRNPPQHRQRCRSMAFDDFRCTPAPEAAAVRSTSQLLRETCAGQMRATTGNG